MLYKSIYINSSIVYVRIYYNISFGGGYMDINLCLDDVDNSLNILKYCALYFDKIHLVSPIKYVNSKTIVERIGDKDSFVRFGSDDSPDKAISRLMLPKDILICTDELYKEGVLEYDCVDVCYDMGPKYYKEIYDHVFYLVTSYMYMNGIFLSEWIPDGKISEEKIVSMLKDIDIDDVILNGGNYIPDYSDAARFYDELLVGIIDHIIKEEPILCGSSIINNIFDTFLRDPCRKKENDVKINALQLLLPQFNDYSIDEVLDIRYKAKDELIQLRHYIESLSRKIDYDSKEDEVDEFIKQEVNYDINEFKRKVCGLKLSTTKNIISNISNPLSYSPLIATICKGVSPGITLAMSLGLISAKTYMEYKKEKNNIQSEALFFKLKL